MVKVDDLLELEFSHNYPDLPKKFVGKIKSVEVTKDGRGIDCVYVNIELEDGTSFSEKYSPIHIEGLIYQMLKAGVEDTEDLVGLRCEWELEEFGGWEIEERYVPRLDPREVKKK